MGVSWKADPAEPDHPAAASYLSLLMPPAKAARIAALFRAAPTEWHPAKDLVRASGLPLLPEDNEHVAADLHKIQAKHPLSPLLIVRGSLTRHAALTVADGYHRLMACYHYDEDTPVSCRIVDHDW